MSLGGYASDLAGADVDQLLDEAERLRHRDAERCSELLERAERSIAGHRDLCRSARINEIRGDLAVASAELGSAAALYRVARRNWLAAGCTLDAARAALSCARVQILVGEFADAETAVLRVQEQLGREASHHDSRVVRLDADVQRQLGDARAGMGRVAVASRHYDTAENLYAALGDGDSMAILSLRRGLLALDAGLAHNAMVELSRARAGLVRAGRGRAVALVVTVMADAMSSTGQVARALEVLDLVQPDVAGSSWHEAVRRAVRSNVLLRAGLPAEAHSEARTAEELFTRLGAVEYSARAALSAAGASLRWGRTDVAAGELEVAERLFAECGSHLMRVRTWLAQAELALTVDDGAVVHARCERVVGAGIDDTAPSLGVRARLLWARVEEPGVASALLDDAADLATRTGMPELRADVLLARARHQRRVGDSDSAVESFESALSVGRAWERHLDGRGVGSVTPSLSEATEELIDLLLERNEHLGRIEAWQRAHHAKCESLVPWADGARTSTPPATEEERQLRLAELLDEFLQSRGAGPAGLRKEELPPVPWGTLVEYHVTSDDVVAFVVRDGQVDARPLRDSSADTRRLVSAWQQECRLMAAGSGTPLDGLGTSPALDGLYEMLVAPIADLLTDLDDEIEVIGHRHLHAVPFDALLDEGGPWHSRLDGTMTPLVEDPPSRTAPPNLAALVLAVADENAPLITAEAEMIFRTLPTADILVDREATREALARRAPSAHLVHFACHGVFRHENPLSSALRLGDGWLSARDIVNGSLGLQGSVVVLSACGSGLSPDYVSEPIGLATACLAAGAVGVVAALWAVDDAVTFKLMTFFYQGLAKGLDPARALRHARRLVARLHPHPYYWAAFRYIAAKGCGARGGRELSASSLAG